MLLVKGSDERGVKEASEMLVTLNITLSNAGKAKVGDLNVILREFNRDAYPVDIGSMYIQGKRNVSEISVIYL